MIKIGVLFLGRKRPGFDPEWGKKIIGEVKAYLAKIKHEVFLPSVQIVDDSSLRVALKECKDAKVAILIILQPTISDGNLSASLCHLWNYPLVLWATPTRQEGPTIASNSLVGTHITASILSQMHHPYEIVYGMPKTPGFEKQFNTAIYLAYAGRKIKETKVGLIGAPCPGYINVQADAATLKAVLGIQLYHTGLKDLFDVMDALSEQEVKDDIEKTLALGFPFQDVTVAHLDVASRYYLAMKQLMSDENLDALAVRCWPELPNVKGQWPYLAFSRLLSDSIVVGCEGDVDGAISCLLGNLLGFGPGYISDWLEHDDKTITIWHTGNPVFQMLEPVGSEYGPKIARHFNNGKPSVVEGRIKPGQPITIFRLWRFGDTYRMAAFEAETIMPERHLMGTNGLAKINGLNPNDLFDELCHAGMPHHISIFLGHHRKTLSRFSRLSGINWIGY